VEDDKRNACGSEGKEREVKGRGGVEGAADELEDARLVPEERSPEVVGACDVRLTRYLSSHY